MLTCFLRANTFLEEILKYSLKDDFLKNFVDKVSMWIKKLKGRVR
jgi:hypothetical protein